ncbi:flavin reductase family protein [Saccharothrix coeruleofusca]|uniref:Flavin oxidoreductase n=1 Tax=Saccharothrix coeruleofusca TaxID=33919 RepID=A0A918EGV2_9PSEU|nr:flavin reductase family protein [Saccharothrix coeruleofusca]MBP2334757.1 3-hydroxy-9,10-secoandrosta-1,3,5(10)-triene-9,17-dione monooxygenase reductase component [Saccharothrix coeruleofusca]GGP74436.1 flavin oxidoreductase [Saccharothrix coeruleofusca]
MTQLVDTVDQRQLRTALGHFATGVAVVTTLVDGAPIGMTVNSLCSVSLAPPMLLFCVGHRSQLHPLFASASHFGVHVLSARQEEVCEQFARPGRSRFGDLEWQPGLTGAPLLPNSLVTLECAAERVIPAGDHDIVLMSVQHLHPLCGDSPLLFFAGAVRDL